MSQNSQGASFVTLIQDFFCQHLIAQRNASKQTVASYRDTIRLFIRFVQKTTGKCPTKLHLTDLDATLVLKFLDSLEQERGNSPRTRNNRLAAIRSFVRYASHKDPTCLPTVQQVLAIPMKRYDRPMLAFLSREQVQAIIDAPDKATWSGHRDHVLFTTLYNTGARVSEIINLRAEAVRLVHGPSVLIHGKGRKERAVPLWKTTADRLKEWMARIGSGPETPVFPNRMGKPMSRSGVEDRLHIAVRKAQRLCPSLNSRRVSPHTLRHTTAMHLLQSGVDITVIALWLGHESPVTTHGYIEADMTMKEQAIGKFCQVSTKAVRYRPTKDVLAFLENL